MKNINKILTLSLAVLAAGCSMDTEPMGGTITSEQKDKVVQNEPSKAEASVNSIFASMTLRTAAVGSSYHQDFGFPAVALIGDHAGQDMIAPNTGYNWFSGALGYTDRTQGSDDLLIIWNTLYSSIYTANKAITKIEEVYENAEDPADISDYRFFRAQALGARAFFYLNLAQYFQFTYDGHEENLCVPWISEQTEDITNNPRQTVETIYGHIMDDLDEAIDLLGKTNKVRVDKRYISQEVAYGIRARVNLLMHNYGDAIADAEKAMNGFRPYSIAELSKPTFNEVSPAWMWAIVIAETDPVVLSGIVNWPSHLCSFAYGYTGAVHTYRSVSATLYDQIPSTDVRKGWWLDENGSSPLLVDEYSPEQIDAAGVKAGDLWFGYEPYVNVKFGAWKNEIFTSTSANPWPLMRVEEMYLIKAEALAMSGKPGEGKAFLESFVRTYRNRNYSLTGSSAEAVQNGVWFQRRVEFWGEGQAYFDIMRLKKPIYRIGAGYPADWVYVIEPESPIMLYLIPQSEITSNEGITDKDQNQIAPKPTPVG